MSKNRRRLLGQYFTDARVSRLLVENIDYDRPDYILELGAGKGSLISAAAKKWKSASLYTADIDTRLTDFQIPSRKHSHKPIDALSLDLPIQIGLPAGKVDVSVCNPPYVSPKWNKAYGHILEEAGLSGSIPSIRDTSADVLFLAQNLRMLRDQGELGIIVPDGFISGEKFENIRLELLRRHGVARVIQLPRNIFGGTEAQTYILVITKNGGESVALPLYKAISDGSLSSPIVITSDFAKKRLDYQHYAQQEIYSSNQSNGKHTLTIGMLGGNVCRGSLTWCDAKRFRIPCFHTTEFKNIKDAASYNIPRKFWGIRKYPSFYLVAEQGDILIGRVGRRLEEQIVLVEIGRALLTDCVFRLRMPRKHRKMVWRFLTSKSGQAWLKSRSRGVCARSISKAAILDAPIM